MTIESPTIADRPLSGITVIETSSFLTGPFASMMLSDLGADVIKVEPPGGDGFRRFGHNRDGFGASWTNANRGKRSIVIDLKTAEGMARLKHLLTTADVLIENWRPRVSESLGLGEDVVRELNSRLIRLSINGFGKSGALANAPAFDSLIQGRTGIVASEGRNGMPAVTPFNMVDKVTGTFGAQAVLAALYERERTGKGAVIQLPMLDVMGYFNFPDMFQHRTFQNDRSDWKPPASQVLATSDGYVVISPANGQQMSKTLNAIERPEWKEDFKRMPDPVAMANEFFRRVGEVVVQKDTKHWLRVFAEQDVPAAPVFSLDEFLQDGQVAHNRIFSKVDSHIGPIRTARHPAIFDDRLMTARSGPPAIGEHDAEIAPAGGES
ncbi:CoA transferase [Paracoccus versutus]|uniref:Crotonobetainyl-CoA:carnitine CoA-transferase CaiB-like acyl-CoA transferase n=1 Tax=Paracoccus versutus TaxID=34007 RepID=A0AAQ0KLG9_PARVE|nr:CoA transferase [Paracoccus versutus]KGJ12005.1 racemase [Paracoccus versutus]REG46434.1 crotonobetainyl-CoA:carnitine CoA-transferase CaiB-like acyl-CoA transferase [Paracoccus versutus]WEJ78531.1 CoA transferase [Paracoccus versutus]